MSPLLYGLYRRLFQILARVPVGTNLGLLHLLFTLLSGRFLPSRGALFPALVDIGLSEAAVRRSGAALRDGQCNLAQLLPAWRACVLSEGHWRRHSYEGYPPVAVDLVGFFRHLLRQGAHEAETQLQARLLKETARTLAQNEMLVTDAGFSLADLLENAQAGFVTRLNQNVTSRRNRLPEYKGWDRCARPTSGRLRRMLARLSFSDLRSSLDVIRGQIGDFECLANKILCYSPQKPKRFYNSLLCAGNVSRTGEERVIL